eukprot:8063986-Pyramimonas_sp.AAC.1
MGPYRGLPKRGPSVHGEAGIDLNGAFRCRFVFVVPRIIFNPPLLQNQKRNENGPGERQNTVQIDTF